MKIRIKLKKHSMARQEGQTFPSLFDAVSQAPLWNPNN